MLITKASGLTEEFKEEKISKSLAAAGLDPDLISQVITDLKDFLKPGATTNEIYDRVNDFLRVRSLFKYAYNYDLKRAIMKLGPTGYPFEEFVAKVLNTKGYSTRVGQILPGRCLSHEVDIDANHASTHYLIECKFHNQPGTKTDIQVVLYTYARFMDLSEQIHSLHPEEVVVPWLITNTKVSKDAITYANCRQLQITSWTYPEETCLRRLVIESGLHPITCLNSLREDQLYSLLHKNIILCSDLSEALKRGELADVFDQKQKHELVKELNAILMISY